MGSKIHITSATWAELATRLKLERKRQGLTREQTAAVCNVSTSFIRDAESNPGSCTLERLALFVQGLGLQMSIEGWRISEPAADLEQPGEGKAP